MSRLLQGWHFMRALRLVLGVAIIWQSAHNEDWVMATVGGLFALLAVANIGCCGPNGCSTTNTFNQRAIQNKRTQTFLDKTNQPE